MQETSFIDNETQPIISDDNNFDWDNYETRNTINDYNPNIQRSNSLFSL